MSRPLPRYTEPAITHDPLLALIARRQAKVELVRSQILAGTYLTPDPADLRGIPCIARGVGGTSPGTNPVSALHNRTRLT
jgi:hypothetical protein